MKTLLTEATVSGASAGLAMEKMVSYIQRKLGVNLIKIPGIEHFKNSQDVGYGVRYVFAGSTKCIRFNWNSEPQTGKAAQMQSIDIFMGKTRDPNFQIHTKGLSLVKCLPAVVDILEKPTVGRHAIFPVDEKEALTESVVMEAKRDDFTAEEAVDDFLKRLAAGASLTRSDFIGSYHIVHAGIFDTVMKDLKDQIQINGKRVSLKPGIQISKIRDSILSKAGTIEVTRGGTKEVFLKTKEEAAVEKEEKVPFVDTLEHLEGLTTSIIKGAFNALFVAGRGGTGKTQTVERVLESHGLSDGNGYFKNTGSASAAGVYTLLYHHRNEIILFDDSDGALADQDARNLIKAATDTKKKRKMVWNKKSSFIFDPESEDPEDYEEDPSMAPKFFDFTGRIIFISNLPLSKLDPDGAIRTRAFIINVDPTDDELFEHMERILFDIKLEEGLSMSKQQRQDVLAVVKTSKRKGDVSLRKLVRALNLAASGAANWETLVKLYA